MKIAFLVSQQSNYRLLGPVIDRALASGWHVECWPDHSFTTTGVKKYLYPAADKTPSFAHGRPIVRSYDGPSDLVQRLERQDMDAVVALSPMRLGTAGAAIGDHSPWVMLQSGPDTFHYPSDDLERSELLLLHSPWWLNWGVVHRGNVEGVSDLAGIRAKLEPRCRYVGFPEAECAELVGSFDSQRWNSAALEARPLQ